MPYSKDKKVNSQRALEHFNRTGGWTPERLNAHRQRELDRRHADSEYRERINAAGRKSYWKLRGAKIGTCPICLREMKLVRDHSHVTGKDRDKICNNCNLILGHSKENIETLRRAITYLERYSRVSSEGELAAGLDVCVALGGTS